MGKQARIFKLPVFFFCSHLFYLFLDISAVFPPFLAINFPQISDGPEKADGAVRNNGQGQQLSSNDCPTIRVLTNK